MKRSLVLILAVLSFAACGWGQCTTPVYDWMLGKMTCPPSGGTTYTVVAPIMLTNSQLSCAAATGSQAGCLSSTDWTTFNGKQNAITNYSTISALTGYPTTFAPTAHNLLSASHGDTTAASPVVGDLITGQAGPVWARLPGNTTTTRKFARSVGDGSGNPTGMAWDTLQSGDVPVMVAAGTTHAAGAVGDPGATAHTPPYYWGDDAAFHTLNGTLGLPLPSVVRTSSAILTIGGNCSATYPCGVSFGIQVYQITASATVTLSYGAGTGTAYIYATSAGVVTVGHNLTNADVACSAGCTKAAAVTQFPYGTIPLFSWTATTDTWDVSGGTDERALGNTLSISSGYGIALTPSSTGYTIAVDSGTNLMGGWYTVGVTAVTEANTLVRLATDGTIIPNDSSTATILGVAASTGTTGQTIFVCQFGACGCKTEGASTAGQYSVAGTTNPQYCKNSTFTSLGMMSWITRWFGKFTTSVADGQIAGLVGLGPARIGGLPPPVLTSFGAGNYSVGAIAPTGLSDRWQDVTGSSGAVWTMTGWTLRGLGAAGAACTISIDVCSASNAIPTSCSGAGSIFNGGTVPNLTAQNVNTATGLSIPITQGYVLRANVPASPTPTCLGAELTLNFQ